jgi:ATP-dependent exoDNAse (exonuclease V) alpha subunit
MQVIHMSVKPISRNNCRSAVASAAYRSGEKIRNDYNGRTHNYQNRNDVVYKEIILPDNAPRNFYDRKILWNAVEKIEKAKNARMAREVEADLPSELDRAEHIRLVERYVKETFVAQGMCADICIHDKGDGNPQTHIMLTTRSMDENGRWRDKQRKHYHLNDNGNKIYDRVKKQYKCGSIKITDWDNRENVDKWRREWAKACNREFELKKMDKEVTHESYKRQNSELEPTIHLGHRADALKRRNIDTDRRILNRVIGQRNKDRVNRERLLEQNRTRSRGR